MKALYAGSFDPFTNGHLDIVRRASRLFEEVVVAIGFNEAKTNTYMFSPRDREDMVRISCAEFDNVKVISYSGLLMQVAEEEGADVLLRGVRSEKDREYEGTLFEVHRMWNPDIETLFMFPDPSVSKLSSTFVKQVAAYEGSEPRLAMMVPPPVLSRLVRPACDPETMMRQGMSDAISYFPSADPDHVRKWIDKLCEEYGKAPRVYHDQRHIAGFLRRIYEHWRAGDWSTPEAFPAAIFAALFHDYVYVIGSKHNESYSFDVFEEQFWEEIDVSGTWLDPVKMFTLVWTMIEATDHLRFNSGHRDPDVNLFVDIDLAGFSEDFHDVHRDSQRVREEFQSIPDDQFWSGRVYFMEALRSRPLYFSDPYKGHSVRGEENIRIEIEYARYRAEGGPELNAADIISKFGS